VHSDTDDSFKVPTFKNPISHFKDPTMTVHFEQFTMECEPEVAHTMGNAQMHATEFALKLLGITPNPQIAHLFF
jgi:hypothetical protein